MSGAPQRISWSLFLFLGVFFNPILACLKCGITGREALQNFNAFVSNQNEEDTEAYIKLKRFVAVASTDLMEEIERMFLDHYAIFQISQEYKRCVDRIEESNFKGDQLINTIGIYFQRLKVKFTDIISKFDPRVCPNKKGEVKCGIMVQKFIACYNCEEEKLLCVGVPSNLAGWFVKCGCYCTSEKMCYDLKTAKICIPCEDVDQYFKTALMCGERSLEIEEEDDLILDCTLLWHAKLEEQYQYVFYKMSDQTTLRIVKEPFFIIRGVQMKDTDVYICRTELLSHIPVSIITFNVTVVKGPEKRTYRPPPSLPYLAPVTQHTVNDLTIEETINKYTQITIYTCGTIIIILIIAACFCIFRRKNKQLKHVLEKQKQYNEDMLLLTRE